MATSMDQHSLIHYKIEKATKVRGFYNSFSDKMQLIHLKVVLDNK